MKATFDIGGDLTVNRLGYGAMRITGAGVWGWPPDRQRAKRLLGRVVELGIQLIDTADAYGPETSEYLIAEALHPYDGLVVATKGGLERKGPKSWKTNGRPEHLEVACHNSLRRLEVERIDLYQLHAIDDDVPLAESVGALAELQKKGKIRHVGVSNFSVEELKEARTLVDVVSVQNRFNLVDRKHEAVLDYCTEHGIGFIPFFPLAAGDLVDHQDFKVLAEKYDATAGQLALAWLLRRSDVILPIPGTSSIDHLEQNTKARDIDLSDEDFDALSKLDGLRL
jgi:aryl-alcohol dehydrogenase-like predicted oxidoreductase